MTSAEKTRLPLVAASIVALSSIASASVSSSSAQNSWQLSVDGRSPSQSFSFVGDGASEYSIDFAGDSFGVGGTTVYTGAGSSASTSTSPTGWQVLSANSVGGINAASGYAASPLEGYALATIGTEQLVLVDNTSLTDPLVVDLLSQANFTSSGAGSFANSSYAGVEELDLATNASYTAWVGQQSGLPGQLGSHNYSPKPGGLTYQTSFEIEPGDSYLVGFYADTYDAVPAPSPATTLLAGLSCFGLLKGRRRMRHRA